MSTRRRAMRESGDEGSSLILALIVVLVVGSFLASVLQFTGTGLTLAPSIRNDRNEANYVQGAVEGAINEIRGSSESGVADGTCPDFDLPATDLPGVESKAFRVTCEGQENGFLAGDDQPRFAIHTVGTGVQGVRQTSGNDELYVDGGIYSRGVVTVGGGDKNTLRANGTITAEGSCVTALVTIFTTDDLGPQCNVADSPSFGSDPAYPPSLGSAGALAALIATGSPSTGADPVPACTAGTATFGPGFFGTRPDLLAGLHGCSATTFRFTPGVYYFDWDGLWDISGVKVIGGGNPSVTNALGGNCVEGQPGVQFVFGGSTRIEARSSTAAANGMEVCGPSAAQANSQTTFGLTRQRIALYGLSSANAVTTPGSSNAVLVTDVNPTQSGPAWTNPNQARLRDAASATVTLGQSQAATLAFSSVSDLPKGARVTAASLTVSHALTEATASVRLTGAGVAATGVDVACPTTPTCTIDLLPRLTRDVVWRGLNDLRLSYTATGSSGGNGNNGNGNGNGNGGGNVTRTAALNGMDITVTYTVPALRALTCLPPTCTFVLTTNNPNVFFDGTVYTPSAGWSVRIHNSGDTIFGRGIIVRDLEIDASGSSKQTDSPFQLPKGTPEGRTVLFRGFADGVEKVQACAEYTDRAPTADAGTTAAYFGYKVRITRWLYLRDPSSPGIACT